MLRRVVLVLLLLSWPLMVQAQCPGVTTQLTPFATETLPIGPTATPLSSGVYKPAGTTPVLAMASLEGGEIRYAVIGTPTNAVGHLLAGTPSQSFPICGLDSLAAFQAIQAGATAATLTLTYYKIKSP